MAGVFLALSVVAGGAATARTTLERSDRSEHDAFALQFAGSSLIWDGGTARGGHAATVLVGDGVVAASSGYSGLEHVPTGDVVKSFGVVATAERAVREDGPEERRGAVATHGAIVFATEAIAYAGGPGSDRLAATIVPPSTVVGWPDAWLDRAEVSGELPRSGTGLQDTGYALHFEVPEPGAYGLFGAVACAALALVRQRRRGPSSRGNG